MKSLITLVSWSILGSTAVFAKTSIEQLPIEHIPHAIQAAPAGWSLAGLEAVALERNPTLIQAGAQVAMSRGKSLQAGLWQNTNLGYVAEQVGTNGNAGELHVGFSSSRLSPGGKLQLSRAKYARSQSGTNPSARPAESGAVRRTGPLSTKLWSGIVAWS